VWKDFMARTMDGVKTECQGNCGEQCRRVSGCRIDLWLTRIAMGPRYGLVEEEYDASKLNFGSAFLSHLEHVENRKIMSNSKPSESKSVSPHDSR